jgi:hypothetical protein
MLLVSLIGIAKLDRTIAGEIVKEDRCLRVIDGPAENPQQRPGISPVRLAQADIIVSGTLTLAHRQAADCTLAKLYPTGSKFRHTEATLAD